MKYRIGNKVEFVLEYGGKLNVGEGEVVSCKVPIFIEPKYLIKTLVQRKSFGMEDTDYECFWIKESHIIKRLIS